MIHLTTENSDTETEQKTRRPSNRSYQRINYTAWVVGQQCNSS